MHIWEDTRQKEGKHTLKHEFWASEGDVVTRHVLRFGDYCIALENDNDIPPVSVDTKADIAEICQNLCGAMKERKRFTREVKGAQDAECRLVFLIEDRRYSDVSDLYGKKIYMHSGRIIKGDQLANAIQINSARYGCEFAFCAPEDAGRMVKEILEE